MNIMTIRCLAAMAVALTTASCQGQAAKQGATPQSDQIPSSVGAALLGNGYDSHRVGFSSSCVKLADGARPEYAGNQKATLKFDKRLSYEQLKNLLNVEVRGKLNFGTFNVSGASKFVSDAASTSLSESVIFATDIRGKTALFNDVVLNPLGEKLAKTNDALKIRATCGDEYVYGVDLGSQLLVNVKFVFSNKKVKADFKAHIKFNMVDLFNVKGRAKVFSEKFQKHVAVTISAIQIGGNVQNLTKIFGESSEQGVPLIQCSLKKPAECAKAMEKIIAYVRGDYAEQLKNLSYDPSKPHGAAFLGYHTRSYARGGGNLSELYKTPGPVLAGEISAARERLKSMYAVLKRHRARSSRLLLLDSLKESERQVIQQIDEVIKANTKNLVAAAVTCYDFPDDCVAAEQGYDPKPYDAKLLVHRMSFVDYCLLSGINTATDKTVAAIRTVLEMPNQTCHQVADTLSYAEKLDLSGREISSVEPLADLTGLLQLDLSNNKIKVTKDLRGLSSLRKLVLRYNVIGNLSDFASLTSLKELNLGYNEIINVAPLAELKGLEVLYLHGNWDIADYSPVEALSLDLLIRTEDDICRYERDWVYGLGKVTPADYEFYKEINFAPQFVIRADHSSAIESWVNCSVAASDY